MKIKVSKAILSGLLAGSLTFSGCGLKHTGVEEHYYPRKGHEPILFFENIFVDEDDFVLLNVGDHDTIGTWLQDPKIKVLNHFNISIGIIINSDASCEDDILNDVEYVKGLIEKYHISFPVYLNIDSIISNSLISNEEKSMLILEFLEECNSNHIYAGISGYDSNLCQLKDYCDITGYDAYLIQDQKDIHYDGECSVVKYLSGDIVARKAIENMIIDGCYNQERDIEIQEFNRLPSLINPSNIVGCSILIGLGYGFVDLERKSKQKKK